MPTQTTNFDAQQGALTIFYDQTEAENSLQVYMKRVFPLQQYVYKKTQQLPDGKGLIQNIQQVLESYEVILPPQNRFVFCYYIDLKDLTDEWVDAYFERAETLKKAQPVTSMMDQHHVVCLRYKVNSIESEEEKQAVIRRIIRLYTENDSISKQIFYLRTTAFQSFDAQENGLINALFLLSRADRGIVASQLGNYHDRLRMLEYADFYEGRTANCDREIDAIMDWLQNPNDAELSRAAELGNQILASAVRSFYDRSRNFNRLLTLYPASEDDFEGNKLMGFHLVQKNDQVIEECKRRFMQGKKDEVLQNVSFEELEQLIQDEYHYEDRRKLSELVASGQMKTKLKAGFGDNQKALPPETGELEDAVREKILDVMKRNTEHVEEERAARELELKQLRKERQSSSYQTLEQCFLQIDTDTRQKPINGQFGDLSYSFAFVNNTCMHRLTMQNEEIKGIPSVHIYSGIDPNEVVLLKEYLMVKLTAEDAEERLAQIID